MTRTHAARSVLVLSIVSTLFGSATALADCPSSLGSTARMNCLNNALNAAVSTISAQQTTITAQQTEIAALTTKIGTVVSYVVSVDDEVGDLSIAQEDMDLLFTYLTVDTDHDALIFSGANLIVQNGMGSTGSMNQLGNIILGYNEDNGDTRTGSHNLVVGPYHTYAGYSDIIGGYDSIATSSYSGILGGQSNTVSGSFATVSGGDYNTASGEYSAIAGGRGGVASAYLASVLSGDYNTASVTLSTVVAGAFNTVSGNWSAILGGHYNTVSGRYSSLVGGEYETMSADGSTTPDP